MRSVDLVLRLTGTQARLVVSCVALTQVGDANLRQDEQNWLPALFGAAYHDEEADRPAAMAAGKGGTTMTIVRGCLTAAAILVLAGGLIVAGCWQTQKAREQMAREERARRQRYLEHWLVEEKQALVSGKRDSVYFYSTTGTDWIVGEFAGMPEIKTLVFESTDLTDSSSSAEAG